MTWASAQHLHLAHLVAIFCFAGEQRPWFWVWRSSMLQRRRDRRRDALGDIKSSTSPGVARAMLLLSQQARVDAVQVDAKRQADRSV